MFVSVWFIYMISVEVNVILTDCYVENDCIRVMDCND